MSLQTDNDALLFDGDGKVIISKLKVIAYLFSKNYARFLNGSRNVTMRSMVVVNISFESI